MLSIHSTNDLLYLPQFVAADLGFMSVADASVRFERTASGYGVLDAAGAARESTSIVLGSLWFCLATHADLDPWIPFAQSNRACHHVLVGRRSTIEPAAIALRGSVIIVPTDAPTPFAVIQHALRGLGLTSQDVRLVVGVGVADAKRVFRLGVGDYLLLPAQEAAVFDSPVAWSITELVGAVPWSVYAVRRSAMDDETMRCEIRAFVAALGRAQAWIAAHSVDQLVDVAGPRFPDTTTLKEQLGALMALQVWADQPALDIDAAQRWAEALQDCGLVPGVPPLVSALVDCANTGLSGDTTMRVVT